MDDREAKYEERVQRIWDAAYAAASANMLSKLEDWRIPFITEDDARRCVEIADATASAFRVVVRP